MSNTIYLYLKTHNKTGLKYLGKTIQDPFSYKGSGKVWSRHIAKHGYDVTTEVLFETNDTEELKRVGLEYSEKWNIVESDAFANLMPEAGTGGCFDEQSKIKISNTLAGRKHSEERKRNISKGHVGMKYSQETIDKRIENTDYVAVSESVKATKGSYEWKVKMYKTCDHCGKWTDPGNFKRFHGDACKHRPTSKG